MDSFDFSKKIFCHPQHVADIKAGKRVYPITVELDLTSRCNHKCTFCYTPDKDKRSADTLDVNVVKGLLEELAGLGVKGISYTGGGEPTLHPDFANIIAFGKMLGFDQGLMTNGSILDKYINNILNNMQWIRISIGGGDRKSYKRVQRVDHFDRVLDNVARLIVDRSVFSNLRLPYTGLRMLVNEQNIESLPNLASRLESELPPDYVQLAPDQFAKENILDKQRQQIERFKDALPKQVRLFTSGYKIKQRLNYPTRCYAHLCQIAIKANGEVLFCKNVRAHEGFVLGNVNNKSFTDIWNSRQALVLEQKLRPNNCGVFCKNSCLNESLEATCNPPEDIQPNFVN